MVRYKQAQANARLQDKELSAKKQEILELLHKKQQEKRQSMSEEDLLAELEKIEAQQAESKTV